VAYIRVRKQRITPLIEAVQKQNVEAVRTRIGAGDDVGATDSYGQTALHWATKYDSVEIVELLVAAGANPSARDEDGDTPLGNAQKNSNPLIASALAHGKREGRKAGKKWWQFWK
jgi:ankyrin repeat protein